MFKQIILFIYIFELLTLNVFATQSAVFKKNILYKYVGEVSGNRINIRIGPHLSHDVITQANNNDKLYVISEKEDWIEVILPHTTSVWIHSKMVNKIANNAIIKKNKVNIRVGPSTKSSVVCQGFKGDELTILSEKFEWLQVKTPYEILGWVHKKHLKYFLSIDEYEKIQKRENLEQLFKDVELIYQNEILKPDKIDYDYLLALYRNMLNNYDNSYPEYILAKDRYVSILEKKAGKEWEIAELILKQKQNEKQKDLKELIPLYKEIVNKYGETKTAELAKQRLKFLEKTVKISNSVKKQKKAVIIAKQKKELTGVIYDLGGLINRPATHKLMKGNEIICLLRSKKINLEEFIYKKAVISGVLIQFKNWDIPVFEVKKIRTLSWKGRMRR
jgi:SH3-like domain-containing protein